MATYAQISDVRALAPAIAINAGSTPNEGTVQAFIERIESELNATLGNLGYVVPVESTATESRKILKGLVAKGALGETLMARALGVDSSLLDAATAVTKQFREMLKALKSAGDPFELPDATRTDGAPVKDQASLGTSFADELTDDDIGASRITRDQAF